MSVAADIAATYRGPRRVVRGLLDRGRREDLALRFLLIASVLLFAAQAPYQAREAFYDPGVPVQARLYWSGFLLIFLFPLVIYAVTFMLGLGARLLPGGLTGYGLRLCLFWALLASSPVALLAGLVAGFIGPGPQLQIVGAAWLGVFLWFLAAGLREARS